MECREIWSGESRLLGHYRGLGMNHIQLAIRQGSGTQFQVYLLGTEIRLA